MGAGSFFMYRFIENGCCYVSQNQKHSLYIHCKFLKTLKISSVLRWIYQLEKLDLIQLYI